jgi:hypothetical protein
MLPQIICQTGKASFQLFDKVLKFNEVCCCTSSEVHAGIQKLVWYMQAYRNLCGNAGIQKIVWYMQAYRNLCGTCRHTETCVVHLVLVLCPSCIPEKVDVNKKKCK